MRSLAAQSSVDSAGWFNQQVTPVLQQRRSGRRFSTARKLHWPGVADCASLEEPAIVRNTLTRRLGSGRVELKRRQVSDASKQMRWRNRRWLDDAPGQAVPNRCLGNEIAEHPTEGGTREILAEWNQVNLSIFGWLFVDRSGREQDVPLKLELDFAASISDPTSKDRGDLQRSLDELEIVVVGTLRRHGGFGPDDQIALSAASSARARRLQYRGRTCLPGGWMTATGTGFASAGGLRQRTRMP